MAISNKAAQSIESLDFDTIKSDLIKYLTSQEEFQDYNFEGSGFSVLLDVLSYNTHHMAFYANMLANESFLDSCVLRSSAVSLGKSVGYIPRSRRGSEIVVDVKMVNNSSDGGGSLNPLSEEIVSRVKSGNYSILKNEVFTTTKGGETLYFYSVNNVFFTYEGDDTDGNPVIYARNVLLREGKLNTKTFVVNNQYGEDQRFIIPDSNLDDRSVSVFVRKSISESEGSTEKWFPSTSIIENGPATKVFFLQEVYDGYYEVYFGDGIIGQPVEQGNIIFVTYASCSGVDGNSAGISDSPNTPNFTYISSINTAEDTELQNVRFNVSVLRDENDKIVTSYGGQEKETRSSIKFYGPRFYETQDRAVTTNDYIALFQKLYSGSIRSIHVWGGEENDPPEYGKVFVSVRPINGLFLSNQEKLSLENSISTERNMVSITPQVVNPEYLYITPSIIVKYDLRKSSTDVNVLSKQINDYVQIFGLENLSLFEKNFFSGQMIRNILELDESIRSCTVTVNFNKQIVPTFNTKISYSINFENPLSEISSGTYIQSGSFLTYGTGTNALNLPAVRAYFKDNGKGKISLYNNSTNELIKDQFGTVNYDTGKVILNSAEFLLENGLQKYEVRVNAKPRDNDVFSKKNTILEMNYDEVDLTLVESSTVRI